MRDRGTEEMGEQRLGRAAGGSDGNCEQRLAVEQPGIGGAGDRGGDPRHFEPQPGLGGEPCGDWREAAALYGGDRGPGEGLTRNGGDHRLKGKGETGRRGG